MSDNMRNAERVIVSDRDALRDASERLARIAQEYLDRYHLQRYDHRSSVLYEQYVRYHKLSVGLLEAVKEITT